MPEKATVKRKCSKFTDKVFREIEATDMFPNCCGGRVYIRLFANFTWCTVWVHDKKCPTGEVITVNLQRNNPGFCVKVSKEDD